MIELATGTLPWKGSTRKDAEKIKSTVTEKQLFRVDQQMNDRRDQRSIVIQGVPRSLLFLYKQLVPLQYADAPNYAVIKGAIAKEIKAKKVWRWENGIENG